MSALQALTDTELATTIAEIKLCLLKNRYVGSFNTSANRRATFNRPYMVKFLSQLEAEQQRRITGA